MTPNPRYLYNFYSEEGILTLPNKDTVPDMWHLPLMDSLARMCAGFDLTQRLNVDTYGFGKWPEVINPTFAESVLFHKLSFMPKIKERNDSVYPAHIGCTLRTTTRVIFDHWNTLTSKPMVGCDEYNYKFNFWDSQTGAGQITLVSICLAHPAECELLLSKLGLLKIAETSYKLI
jgi:hypothetical protein